MPNTECLVVGHRGFKGKYTENTLRGFAECYLTGATGIETDVWTTKDEVLVISHDVNTKRVFCDKDGNETDYNILQTDYADLKDLRTIGSGEPLLTFQDVLRWFFNYVKSEGNDDVRIQLDIKNANPPRILRLIIEDILQVHNDLAWWFPRISLGVWNLRFVKYLNQDQYFQDVFAGVAPNKGYSNFDILHISTSWLDSMTYVAYNEYLAALPDKRLRLCVTGISIIYIATWTSGFLTKLLPAIKKQDLKLYSWTINNLAQLRYFITVGHKSKIREYGVISDNPDEIIELLDTLELEKDAEKAPEHGAITVPLKFRFFAALFSSFLYLGGPSPLISKPRFDNLVDPCEMLIFRPRWTNKVFAFLQRMGIF